MRLKLCNDETILDELKRRGFNINLKITDQDIHNALAIYNEERTNGGLEPFMFEYHDPKIVLNDLESEETKLELIKMKLDKFFKDKS